MDALAAVDVHTHLAPTFTADQLPSLGLAQSERGLAVIDNHPVGPASLYDASALSDWAEKVGVAEAWVSVPPPFYRQGQEQAATAAWTRAVNDGLVARVAGFASLKAMAYLPLDQPEVALSELHRCAADDRFIGWVGGAGGTSVSFDAAQMASVWDGIEASGRPILLHPGSSPDRRLDEHYLANLLGNPIETTLAAAQLIFGDVLGPRPGLHIVLVHCGGGVPALVGRWQRGLDTRRPGVGELSLAPSAAVRRFWIDALSHDPAVVDLAINTIGEDKLVLGSDWPFPMGLDNPWTAVQHLSAATRERVARANADALRGQTR